MSLAHGNTLVAGLDRSIRLDFLLTFSLLPYSTNNV